MSKVIHEVTHRSAALDKLPLCSPIIDGELVAPDGPVVEDWVDVTCSDCLELDENPAFILTLQKRARDAS